MREVDGGASVIAQALLLDADQYINVSQEVPSTAMDSLPSPCL
jgi:hypothetical protein